MKKRGQTSTEYLIILAVVVIIALIVVGILSGFPSIGRGTSAKASAAYWASAPIGILSYDLSDTAASNSLIIMNNLPVEIMITLIRIGGVNDNIADTTFQPGEKKTVRLTTFECEADESYSYEIVIRYDNRDTTETDLEFTGDVKLEGKCLDA